MSGETFPAPLPGQGVGVQKSTKLMFALGALLVVAVGFSAVRSQERSAAEAAPSAQPSIITQHDVTGAWTAATAAIRQPLPNGMEFQTDPPPFFDDEASGPEPVYSPMLPAQIAARWWRCAWIDASLHPGSSRATVAPEEARSVVDEWNDMPGMRGNEAFVDYDARMASAAREAGKTPFALEYELDCGKLVYTPES